MEDRELLELAAKAAGLEVALNENWQAFKRKRPLIGLGGERHPWVPLDDDGDAFRLACDLKLNVEICDCDSVVSNGLTAEVSASEYDVSADRYKRTRRAIVLCAAKIGESMP